MEISLLPFHPYPSFSPKLFILFPSNHSLPQIFQKIEKSARKMNFNFVYYLRHGPSNKRRPRVLSLTTRVLARFVARTLMLQNRDIKIFGRSERLHFTNPSNQSLSAEYRSLLPARFFHPRSHQLLYMRLRMVLSL